MGGVTNKYRMPDLGNFRQKGSLGILNPDFDDSEAEIDAFIDSIAHGNSIGAYDMLASASADVVTLRRDSR